MSGKEPSVNKDSSLSDDQFTALVKRNAIHYIVLNKEKLNVSELLCLMHQNSQLKCLDIESLLRILDACHSEFELEDQGGGQSQIKVHIAFELQVCHQLRSCCGYPICKALHICKYFIQNKCRRTETGNCQFGHDLHSPHNLQILEERCLKNIDPLILKEWLRQHHNRRYRKSHPPKVCTFYNSFGCKKKDTCTFLHLCSDFVERRCRYGHGCRKSHDFLSQQNSEILLKHRIDVRKNQDQILDILSDNRSHFTHRYHDGSDMYYNEESGSYTSEESESYYSEDHDNYYNEDHDNYNNEDHDNDYSEDYDNYYNDEVAYSNSNSENEEKNDNDYSEDYANYYNDEVAYSNSNSENEEKNDNDYSEDYANYYNDEVAYSNSNSENEEENDNDYSEDYDNYYNDEVAYSNSISENKEENKIPGTPIRVSVKSDRVELQWKNVSNLSADFEYQIQYKDLPDGRWAIYDSVVPHDSSRAVVTGLKSSTSYCFKVRVINTKKGEEYPFSSESEAFMTPESPGIRMLQCSALAKSGNPAIYRLPSKEIPDARNDKIKSKKLSLGCSRLCMNDKTIMLVGATGSGKSTLINGLANYLFEVNWEDDFRFTLVNLEQEEKNRQEDQAMSQTEWVTCYSIYPDVATKLNYALHIVDTPGFGDTRGVQRDKEIIEQIREMFLLPGDKGMACLDAVCFLVKAPDARLTPTQMYILDNIQSLFGKDMEDNICICITFAEAQEPPVLASLAKSPLQGKTYFKFNNSALYASNKDKDDLALGFWKIGIKSFDSFFETLNKMETRSLQMTKEVLKTRQDLENTVHNLQISITAGMDKISVLEEEMLIFKKHERQIRENKDFSYVVTEQVQKRIDISGKGQYTTNCLTCNYTCHENCRIPEDSLKLHCIAIDGHGKCKECPGFCQWDSHHNTPFIIRWVSTKVKKTYREKMELYNSAREHAISQTQVLQKMTEHIKDLERSIAELLGKVTEFNNRLKEIALNENPMNTAEYIDLMIKSEERERKPNYKYRINVLHEFKRNALIGHEAHDFLHKAKQTRESAPSKSDLTSGSFISSMNALMKH